MGTAHQSSCIKHHAMSRKSTHSKGERLSLRPNGRVINSPRKIRARLAHNAALFTPAGYKWASVTPQGACVAADGPAYAKKAQYVGLLCCYMERDCCCSSKPGISAPGQQAGGEHCKLLEYRQASVSEAQVTSKSSARLHARTHAVVWPVRHALSKPPWTKDEGRRANPPCSLLASFIHFVKHPDILGKQTTRLRKCLDL